MKDASYFSSYKWPEWVAVRVDNKPPLIVYCHHFCRFWSNIFISRVVWVFYSGFVESWMLEKVLKICPAIFQSWKKSGKICKKSLVLFSKLKKCFMSDFFSIGEILLNVACMFASFVLYGLYWSPTDVFENLESAKGNKCFGKCLEKVLNFGSKNLFEPWEYFIEKENSSADHSRFV